VECCIALSLFCITVDMWDDDDDWLSWEETLDVTWLTSVTSERVRVKVVSLEEVFVSCCDKVDVILVVEEKAAYVAPLELSVIWASVDDPEIKKQSCRF